MASAADSVSCADTAVRPDGWLRRVLKRLRGVDVPAAPAPRGELMAGPPVRGGQSPTASGGTRESTTTPSQARGPGLVTQGSPRTESGERGSRASASAIRLGVGLDGAVQPDQADGDRRYINRELSTLDFNRRVLAQASAEGQAPLERLKFVAIFSSNLDEFFQVRVAGLKDQQAAGVSGTAPDGLSVGDQLKAIRAEVLDLLSTRAEVLFSEILPLLETRGITLVNWDNLSDEDHQWMKGVFEERIFPVLTPLAVDPGHPFPYISNLSLNLAVIVSDPSSGARRFARVKVPPLLPGFLVTPDGERFVPLEQVIAAHLGSLFPGMVIESHHAFRVTRNLDLSLDEDEADDLLAAVETELRRRRFGRAVRLEVEDHTTDEVKTLLTRELDLKPEDVYEVLGPLDLTGLWAVHDIDRPDLKDEPYIAVTPDALAPDADEDPDIFAAMRRGDVLIHLPYDSFAETVEAFVEQASRDPDVLAIKQTLYRTSGNSPVVRSLIRAAERGKQVAALVELKARGDEAANITWARALERAGVHVVYGLVGLKTHSKTSLVVRQEGEGIRRYCHIGTGNYNSITARLYEDLGILTCDPEFGADLTDLFNYLTGYSRRADYRKLLVAPTGLRTAVLDLIHQETELGRQGRIIFKLNSLVDKEVIDALYQASAAGVQIDIIARSICCLRPGVPGLSETVRVCSLVGRWLEHSRVFYFGNGDTAGPEGEDVERLPAESIVPLGGRYFMGSADLMERNLDRRIEAVIPVEGPLTSRLREILVAELSDDVLSWRLEGDGTWSKAEITRGFNAQQYFADEANARERRRNLGRHLQEET